MHESHTSDGGVMGGGGGEGDEVIYIDSRLNPVD